LQFFSFFSTGVNAPKKDSKESYFFGHESEHWAMSKCRFNRCNSFSTLKLMHENSTLMLLRKFDLGTLNFDICFSEKKKEIRFLVEE